MKALRMVAVLAVTALLVFAATRILRSRVVPPLERPVEPGSELVGAPLPSLAEASGWLNGGPLSRDSLRGRPTLVALWSDTEPECLRALPILEAWHQAYGRFGVRIVGVHEPEFAFAADPSVPDRLARRLRLSFPIALDPAYAIRRHLGSPAEGPRLVLADTAGVIVAAVVGRGGVSAMETSLRAQLRALHAGPDFPADPASLAPPPTRPRGPGGLEAAAGHVVPLGTAGARGGPLAEAAPGRAQNFTAQFRFQIEGEPYVPYPVGLWSPGAEGVTAARGGAQNFIALRYHAGDLWAVVSPPAGRTTRIWVLRDDRWLPRDELGEDARLDGRGASYVDVDEPRLYAVARGAGDRVIKLSPEDPGVTFHALIIEPVTTPGTRQN